MLPSNVSTEEKFQLAKDAGFHRIECPTTRDPGEAERMKSAADKAGIKIQLGDEHGSLEISAFISR